MMPPRVLPILALLLAIPGVASAAEWVLPPAAGEALGAALRLSEPFAGKHILRAELQKSRVVVRAGNDESAQPALHVTLVHPDGAPRGAPRVAGIALLPEPGPAPKALVAELLRRLRAAKQPVPWVDAASDASRRRAPGDMGAKKDKARAKVAKARGWALIP